MLNEYRLTDYPNSNRSSNLKIKNRYLKFLTSRIHRQQMLFMYSLF